MLINDSGGYALNESFPAKKRKLTIHKSGRFYGLEMHGNKDIKVTARWDPYKRYPQLRTSTLWSKI